MSKENSLYIGNLSADVTKDLLHELFLQAGPVINVMLPKEFGSEKRFSFAFIEFKHEESVSYAMAMMDGVQLFGRKLNLQYRSGENGQANIYLNKIREYQKLLFQSAPMMPAQSTNTMYGGNVHNVWRQQQDFQIMNHSIQNNQQYHDRRISDQVNFQQQVDLQRFNYHGQTDHHRSWSHHDEREMDRKIHFHGEQVKRRHSDDKHVQRHTDDDYYGNNHRYNHRDHPDVEKTPRRLYDQSRRHR